MPERDRPPRQITYHYHRPGRGETVFHETLVLDRDDVKVTLLERYEGRTVRAGRDVILEPAAPIVWFVFPGAWHDVGRFHLADGSFTGWYTNLCTPVDLHGDRWACTDLFLDLWQPGDGAPHRWLDEDELRQAAADGVIPGAHVERVYREREAIEARIALDAWPPGITREVDLARARGLAAPE